MTEGMIILTITHGILRRKHLEHYDLSLQIRDFFTDFVGDTTQYAYVSATERRCFNLAYTFLPDDRKENLISNSGLLRYHRELAQQYLREGQFPRILIQDDLLLHGRGLSKFLHQLESAIEADILDLLRAEENPNVDTDGILRVFRRRLAQSIDLVVFARNKSPLLLDDRYLYRLRSQYALPVRDLHDLSWQLSDCLTRWRQANTCFAYSEHNPQLWDWLVSEQSVRSVEGTDWKQLHWQYDGESMGLFLHPVTSAQPDQIASVGTVRFFPGRQRQQWFTSFTLLGRLPQNVIGQLCQQVADLIRSTNQPDCTYILKLLTDESPYTDVVRGQFLSYLLSASDYRAFLKSIPDYPYQAPNAGWIIANSDVCKICRNFGKINDILPGLTELLCSEPWMDAVHELLTQQLRQNACPLCPFPGEDTPVKISEVPFSEYNRCVETLFYELGMDAERNAAKWFYNVEIFQPATYQEYSDDKTNSGILALTSYYDRLLPGSAGGAAAFYYGTAALIHVMDLGLMGVRVASASDADCQIFLCKAGELAVLYGPRSIAVAIPALSYLETACRRTRVSLKELIDRFLTALDSEAFRNVFSENGEIKDYLLSREFQELKARIPAITAKIYYGNQRIAEWNFENLISYPTPGLSMQGHRALQNAMYDFVGSLVK